MTGGAASSLARANERLTDAHRAVATGMSRVAAREAYLTVFHAAQATIFESRGEVAKTHSGVRTLFALLLPEWPSIPGDAARFLALGYRDKTVADYGIIEEIALLGPEEAAVAVERATNLVTSITNALTAAAPRET